MTSRALRVGVLIGGNLVEERVFSGSAPITIGQSLRCTLSVPVDGLPIEHVLFSRDRGRTVLRIAAGMDARIAGPDDAAVAPGAGMVPIERGMRGKLRLGDATILFQDIAPPPVTPRPQLPASVRGTLADRIDRRLAVIVGASLIAHIAIATWAWAIDREEDTRPIASGMRPYQHDVIDITLPDVPEVPEVTPSPTGEPGVAAPVSPRQTPQPVVGRPPDPGMSAADANRYAQILTGADEQRGGTTGMRDRLPVADLGQQIRDIVDENRRVQVGNPLPSRPETARLGTTPRPRIGDPGQLQELPDRDEVPGGRVVPEPDPKQPPPDRDYAATVLAKIKSAYLPGLQRCYRRGLTHDETLSGKVAISFTVDRHGKATEPEASGTTDEVDGCIQNVMRTWRFPFPPDEDGVQLGLKLVLRPS